MTCTSQILQSVPALLRQENQQQQLLYPVNHIAQLDLSAFSTFLKNDNIPTDTTTHHKCGTESNCAVDVIEERLCSFHKVYVKPTTGRNVYGVQRTIINQTNRTQMFSYELCG